MSAASPTLYEHTKRPEWGRAIIATEEPNRRRFQFEDGKIRTFSKGFYHLLKEVTEVEGDKRELVAELSRDLDCARARRQHDGREPEGMISLDRQIEIFIANMPLAFEDPKWLKDKRGQGVKKALKRHREPAVVKAQDLLGPDKLDDPAAAFDAFLDVAKGTDLVKPAEVKKLEALDGIARRDVGAALRDLLYGDGDYSQSFNAFVKGLGDAASWGAATFAPALVHPVHHVAVNHSTFKRQAKWLAPRLDVNAFPSSSLYNELLAMAHSVERGAFRAEIKPRDMLDLHDFMVLTLKPSAAKKLDEASA